MRSNRPKAATLEGTLAALGLQRSLVVAEPFAPAFVVTVEGHPLDGVKLVGVRSVMAALAAARPAGDLEAAMAILRLCTVHEFAVALTETSVANEERD